MADNTGWYEFISATKATTHIAYVHEDGSIYCPEGPAVVGRDDFTFAAARGRVHRLVRESDYAGWRPPARVITDPVELDTLPAKTAVITPQGWVFQAATWPTWIPGSKRWAEAFDMSSVTADYVIDCADSVTVLWEPEVSDRG